MTKVVALGPSLVDISACLPPRQYAEFHEIVGVTAGEWATIECPEDIDRVRSLIGPVTPLDDIGIRPVDAEAGMRQAAMIAGSTTLGMLSAMPPYIRSQSMYTSALAEHGGKVDPLSQFFSHSVATLGVSHRFETFEGRNPIGFVISSACTTEKTLAMHPGVTQELDYCGELDSGAPELVIADAYELQKGKLGDYLDALITSGRFRIALSLGNAAILQGDVRTRVRSYIENGEIYLVSGNEEEYHALFPELGPEQTEPDLFSDHPIKETTKYAMLTRGPNGLTAHWDGEYISVPAHPLDPALIVNTSGAGDTALGVVCGGVMENAAGVDTLRKAAFLATKVLQIPGSMIQASC